MRTLYTVATIIVGISVLGAVGFNDGWVTKVAAFRFLNHLSAGLVYAVWCLQTRAGAPHPGNG